MDNLISLSKNLVENTSFDHKRSIFSYLFQLVSSSNERLIWIFGKRWVWKTTIWLQIIKELWGIYILWHFPDILRKWLFETVKLININNGYKIFFIDEIHHYPNRQLEIKNIYDLLPQTKIIFSWSSYLSLKNSSVDLSRRLTEIYLPNLSFSEFILFDKNISLEKITANDIQNTNKINDFLIEYSNKISFNEIFKEYLFCWQYPFYLQSKDKDIYQNKLMKVIDMVIFEDIPQVAQIPPNDLNSIKKFLTILAHTPPFEVKANQIIEGLDIDKNKYYEMLDVMQKWWLINLITNYSGKWSQIGKTYKKILFSDSNLRAVIWQHKYSEFIWWLREDFFVNCMKNLSITCYRWSSECDFIIQINNEYKKVEIWWKHKKRSDLDIVAKDNIDFITHNEYPLFVRWLLSSAFKISLTAN